MAGKPDQSTVSGRSFSYNFDAAGNTASFQPDAANQYTVNAALAGTPAMSYDPRGNLTDDGRFTFEYDAQDRLTSATPKNPVAGSVKLEFGYDPQGRRIWKKSYVYAAGT